MSDGIQTLVPVVYLSSAGLLMAMTLLMLFTTSRTCGTRMKFCPVLQHPRRCFSSSRHCGLKGCGGGLQSCFATECTSLGVVGTAEPS